MKDSPIKTYNLSPPAYYPYDLRAPMVARRIADLILAQLPEVAVEHIGSTAVPGCAGKGIIDVMVLYGNDQLSTVKDGLAALGFQPQTVGFLFPEDRPMRVGSMVYDDKRFRLHVHVIHADSPEVHALRIFRDRLRADPKLLAAYGTHKQAVVASGVTEAADYTQRKSVFIQDVLHTDHTNV